MRWATHGGIISEGELQQLAAIFSSICGKAEALGVDVVLAMRPFHFVSCARNFQLIAERVGSHRLKCQWSPADCLVSNETDILAAYQLLKPYLHGLHCKDVTTGNGPMGDIGWSYWWCSIGEGEVEWSRLLRLLAREHEGPLYLGICTHFKDEQLPEDEQLPAAMAQSFRAIRGLLP
jgi:sugar phosphate isomerase/epimerase